MLTAEQIKELDGDIQAIVDKRVEERLSKEIIKRFSPNEPVITVTKDAGDQSFASLGEQLIAVKNFATSEGRLVDARLKAPTGASEGQLSEGGFLVQTDFASELLQNIYTTSDIIGRVNRKPISANSNGIKIPAVNDQNRTDGYRHGGIRAYWAAEAGLKTASQPSFDQIALELKKLVGLCYVTDEMLQDAPFLESWIMDSFRDEFNFKLTDAIINGDGAGKPLGILNAPSRVAITAETGQGTSTIVAENIIKMYARRIGSRTGNYVWLINQDIEPQLFTMGLAVGSGGIPVYMPAGGLSAAPLATLMGRPVIPCEHCATLGTTGDIIFTDLSRYLMIDKGGMQSASSIHVKFIYDETTFRFVLRCDGQPMDKTYITPFKGTNYQSAIITLSSTRT